MHVGHLRSTIIG